MKLIEYHFKILEDPIQSHSLFKELSETIKLLQGEDIYGISKPKLEASSKAKAYAKTNKPHIHNT